MERIEWKESKDKSKAYDYLQKAFGVSRPTISLAMKFKRNSVTSGRMREVAVSELGGKYINDSFVRVKPTKILDSKGNVVKVITNNNIKI